MIDYLLRETGIEGAGGIESEFESDIGGSEITDSELGIE